MRILIVGGGQVGTLIAQRLIREKNEIVIVESGEERCAAIEAQLDAKVVQGNATRLRTLREAKIADADMVIACTDSDEVNLQVCLVAQVEAPDSVRIARVRTHEFAEWKKLLAAARIRIDLMIHPESDVAERMMGLLRYPGVSDMIHFADGRVVLFGMSIDEGNWLAGKSLESLGEANPPTDSTVVMIFRGQRVIIPHGAETLQVGDRIYTISTRENVTDAMRFLGLTPRESLQHVFVVGGSQLGIHVAELLEAQNVKVKLFERDPRRAEKVAGLLKKTVVLAADGSDQKVLEEENIEGIDAYIVLTKDDERNIIAALLARRLGATKVVALINRLSYVPMAHRLGVHATVSPRLAAVDRALQFVRKGRVISVVTFREEEAEAIELVASAESRLVGRPLRDLRFPGGAIIGALVRGGEVLVPRGDSVIQGGDRVIFFCLETDVPKLESAFLAEREQ